MKDMTFTVPLAVPPLNPRSEERENGPFGKGSRICLCSVHVDVHNISLCPKRKYPKEGMTRLVYTHLPFKSLKPRLQANATHCPPSHVVPPLMAPAIFEQLPHQLSPYHHGKQ